MTIAEVDRHIKSRIRIRKVEAQEKAYYDYTLASLITKGMTIAWGAKTSFPSIQEVYPDIFNEMAERHQEQVKQQKISLSALRFKQFAQSYNNKFNQGGAINDK